MDEAPSLSAILFSELIDRQIPANLRWRDRGFQKLCPGHRTLLSGCLDTPGFLAEQGEGSREPESFRKRLGLEDKASTRLALVIGNPSTVPTISIRLLEGSSASAACCSGRPKTGGEASRHPSIATIHKATTRYRDTHPPVQGALLLRISSAVQSDHDGFLGMKPIFSLVENDGLRTVADSSADFLSRWAGKQCMKRASGFA